MDELPREARELLMLASDAHDPPSVEARARVRRGVAAAVATGLGVGIAGQAVAQGTLKAGLFSGLAGKLAGAGMAVAVAGTLAVTVPRLSRHQSASPAASHVMRRAARPSVAAELDAQPSQPEAVETEPAASPGVEAVAAQPVAEMGGVTLDTPRPHRAHAGSHKSAAPARTGGLGPEMALLRQASEAIAQNDLPAAERALAQHAREYRSSSLREERTGLTALVHCLSNPVRARREGERFVDVAPHSVLAQRVLRACKLSEAP